MEKEIEYTHTLTITDVQYYKINRRTIDLLTEYGLIDEIENVKVGNQKMLKVRGTHQIKGLTTNGSGFYDIENEKFYPFEYLESAAYYIIKDKDGKDIKHKKTK
jgi:hypothetical protein